jgi:hypothetical protein
MKTLNPSPGKFEGNYSQAIARAVYTRVLDGCADETIGDCSEIGWIANLVTGTNHTFILVEDNQGFVSVDYWLTGSETWQSEWDKLVSECDSFYAEQED